MADGIPEEWEDYIKKFKKKKNEAVETEEE